MLDQVLKWAGAGDEAIRVMGPTLTIILAWLGGYGVTQAFKFPLKTFVEARWTDWAIRTCGIISTFAAAHWLNGLPTSVEFVVAFVQPKVYEISMAVVTKYWPWIEATPLGSAAPSQEAQDQLTVWRTKGKP